MIKKIRKKLMRYKMRNVLANDLSTNKHMTDFNEWCDDNDYNQLKNLLLEKNFNRFNQAASEAMVYYFLKKELTFTNIEHDIKLYKTEGHPKDVDVVGLKEEKISFRIEVKAPEMYEEDEKIHGKIAFRAANTPEAKAGMETSQKDVINSINMSGKSTAVADKLDDLKIKTFIENANEKFFKPSSDNEINILFVSVDTSTMLDFLRYYTNPLTGVFSNDPYFDTSLYLNVDFIVFSNCSECHLDDNFNFNLWDLSNYICFVLPLRKDGNVSYKRQYVDNLFKTKLPQLQHYMNCSPNLKKTELPVEFWSEEFVALNYPHFNCNRSNRKY